MDSIISAFIYDPEAIAVPSNIPIRMFRWYRSVVAFNNAMTPDLLKAPLPRPEFWQRGFSKIAREIFTDRVVAHQVQASLDAFIGTFLAQPKMQTLYSNSESVVKELASYLPDIWNADGYWAVSGLEDTLLRCQIQPEYLNGHYQKEVQQGI